ncbi:MAG: hypothetical protein ACJAYC_000516 [Halieaceae bacterium]|jgi:hypothetical protein
MPETTTLEVIDYGPLAVPLVGWNGDRELDRTTDLNPALCGCDKDVNTLRCVG